MNYRKKGGREKNMIMFTNCKLLLQNVHKRTPWLKGVLLCNYKRIILFYGRTIAVLGPRDPILASSPPPCVPLS